MMRGKFLRHFFVDLLPGRICIARVEIRKCALGAIEQSSGALERDDRIVERRFLRIVRDRLDFLQLLTHSRLNRGDEMLVLNLVEWRVLILQGALRSERIVLEIGGEHSGDLRNVEQRASKEAKTQ